LWLRSAGGEDVVEGGLDSAGELSVAGVDDVVAKLPVSDAVTEKAAEPDRQGWQAIVGSRRRMTGCLPDTSSARSVRVVRA